MKFGIHIVLVVITIGTCAVMQIEGTEETPHQIMENEDKADLEEPEINPRKGRMWAPWSYAGPVTRGRFNVGGYTGGGGGPNVAWDSTMSRGRRSVREGRMWAPWSYAGPVTRGRWNVGGYANGGGRGPNVAWDSTMSRGRRPSHRRRYGSRRSGYRRRWHG